MVSWEEVTAILGATLLLIILLIGAPLVDRLIPVEPPQVITCQNIEGLRLRTPVEDGCPDGWRLLQPDP